MELNKIYQGDCLDVLPTLPDNSVDSIVTDPPYELGFMGKSWDNSGIAYNVDMWKECLRVLKPGGHLLAFSGTRTYHRMTCAIEDAGFEVRDMIEWVYGSGFPKSLNIGKAVDKKPKADSVKDWKKWLDIQINNSGKSKQQINDECGFTATSYVKTDNKDYWSSNLPKNGKWRIMKKVIGIKTDEYDWVEQDNCGERGYVEPTGGLAGGSGNTVGCFTGKQLSNNAIDDRAKQWEGWGTALKPAHEPICMARKPLSEKTVVENVLKYGTGGINIDESRVEYQGKEDFENTLKSNTGNIAGGTFKCSSKSMAKEEVITQLGRFPANLIHDNSEEVRECFPETKSSKGSFKAEDYEEHETSTNFTRGDFKGRGDSGNASRFFKSILYYPKASKSERNKGMDSLEAKPMYKGDGSAQSLEIFGLTDGGREDRKNNHPTVKPVALMEYLIKMITPKGGIVLEPFAGSGSTLVAAKENGFGFIGIELTEDYIPIIEARTGVKAEKIQPIENVIQKTQTEPTSVIKEKPINTQKPKNDIDTCECGGRIVKTASGRCCEQCLADY